MLFIRHFRKNKHEWMSQREEKSYIISCAIGQNVKKVPQKFFEIFSKRKLKRVFFQILCNLDSGTHDFIALFSIFILYHSMSYFLLPFECSDTSLRLQLSISLFQILMDFFLLFHMSQNNFSTSIENNYFRT